jgi:hypothetical protein
MIISASRRTDIPAFFTPWFLDCLKEGFVIVQNPMNPNMKRNVSLDPKQVDLIVFWTKNPRNLMKHLDQLNAYRYYFLFTITPYGPDLEQNVPPKEEVMDTFIELSRMIGKEKVIWRYDPILLSAKIDEDFHVKNFNHMAERLAPYTQRCVISFLDMYKKCERNLNGFDIKKLNADDMTRIGISLRQIAEKSGIEMVTCAEEIDFSGIGIPPGKCIDDRLISKICGHSIETTKDKYQRKACRCVKSIDIGAYNTCKHRCLYCYGGLCPHTL